MVEQVQEGEGFDPYGDLSQEQTPGDDDTKSKVRRGEPQISEERKALVSRWTTAVRADKKHWKPAFDQMRRDQDFAYGKQWNDDNWEDDRYVVNITLRHIQQRTASLYASCSGTRAGSGEKNGLCSTADQSFSSSLMGPSCAR